LCNPAAIVVERWWIEASGVVSFGFVSAIVVAFALVVFQAPFESGQGASHSGVNQNLEVIVYS
jgi:hypothetical protein